MEEMKQLPEEKPSINTIGKVIVTIAVIFLLLITIWYMLNLVLMTFIIGFIFYHIELRVQRHYQRILSFRVPDSIIFAVLYILFIAILVALSGSAIPKLVDQIMWLASVFMNFDVKAVLDVLDPRIVAAIGHIDFNMYIKMAADMIAGVTVKAGGFAVNFFLSMLLSFVILVEKNQIRQFGTNMASSKISFIYEYIVLFGGNFCKTFGKVMKVQVTIAAINCLVSMVGLKLIGFGSIFALSLMIFCLGLIPVAGVIISLIPLCIIAFSFGGIIKVVEVLIMVMVIHAIEAYVLNPKLMSNKTRLPVCFTFMILLVGEHYLGVWGLLIGVPLFIFMMNMFEVDYAVTQGHGKKKGKEKKSDASV